MFFKCACILNNMIKVDIIIEYEQCINRTENLNKTMNNNQSLSPHSRKTPFIENPKNTYNDYKLAQLSPNNNRTLTHQRYSSNSIYYHNNSNSNLNSISNVSSPRQDNQFNRKKLTVTTSRDGSASKLDMRGDHSNNSQPRTSQYNNTNANGHYQYNLSHNQYQQVQSYNNSIYNSQTNEGGNTRASFAQKNKLKRNMNISKSPGLQTPSRKGNKLKKSLISQHNKHHLIHSQDKALQRKNYDNQPSFRLKLGTSKKDISNDQEYTNRLQVDRNIGQQYMVMFRKQMERTLQDKINQFSNKINNQQNQIKRLQAEIKSNKHQLMEKNKKISELDHMIKLSKGQLKKKSNNSDGNQILLHDNAQYLAKRIHDLQLKLEILSDLVSEKNASLFLEDKLQILTHLIVSKQSFQLRNLQKMIIAFIQQKSSLLKTLFSNISYLDNKMVGRSQALRQTLISLKSQVQKLQDTCTKDTNKSQKQSYTQHERENINTNKPCTLSSTFQNSNIHESIPTNNIKVYNSKLKSILKQQKQDEKSSNAMMRSNGMSQNLNTLEFSLTEIKQFGQSGFMQPNNQRLSFGGMDDTFMQRKDQTCLTDEFFYPNSNSRNDFSRSISPVNDCKKSSQKKSPAQQPSPVNQFNLSKSNKSKVDYSSATVSVTNFQKPSFDAVEDGLPIVKIDNKTITKKIQSIKFLMQEKRRASEQQRVQPLRCFVDKSGYLKYSDSKTFVFDGKGNLMSCTEGQFWFLVTKGLIEGKQESVCYEVSY